MADLSISGCGLSELHGFQVEIFDNRHCLESEVGKHCTCFEENWIESPGKCAIA